MSSSRRALLRTALAVAAADALLVAAVRPLRAQTGVDLFVARNGALPGAPTLAGLSVTTFSRGSSAFGLRFGGGMRIHSDDDGGNGSTRYALSAWAADADLVLAPMRHAGSLGGISPYGFVGLGAHGVRATAAGGRTEQTALWTYGYGATLPIVSAVGAMAEARYRVPLTGDRAAPAGFNGGWEYRMGLTFGLGGARGSRAPSAASRAGRTTRPVTDGLPAGAMATRVLGTADDFVGTSYRYGGTSPADGFDCSGFVQYVYGRHGVRLPRTSRQMAGAGRTIAASRSALRPGDLVLFAGDGTHVDHVAIYAGRDRIIHSSSSGGGVRYDDLDTQRGRWFVEHMVAARRVVEDGRSLVGGLGFADQMVDAWELDRPDRAPRPRP